MGAGFGIWKEIERVAAVAATTVFLGECTVDGG